MRTLVQSPRALGRALRDARRRQGLTQQKVAEMAGIGQPTVSNVERGTLSVTLSTLLRILATVRLELIVQDRGSAEHKSPSQDLS